jgi:uncharacterized membrane protein YadS
LWPSAWALFFVTRVEKVPGTEKLGVKEIWLRFPKFILGFVGASLLMSFVFVPWLGQGQVDGILAVTATAAQMAFSPWPLLVSVWIHALLI